MSRRDGAGRASFGETFRLGERDAAARRSADSYHDALVWAGRSVPDQHAPFAAAAALTLRLLKRPVTAAEVRAHLAAQSRDAVSLGVASSRSEP